MASKIKTLSPVLQRYEAEDALEIKEPLKFSAEELEKEKIAALGEASSTPTQAPSSVPTPDTNPTPDPTPTE